MFCRTNSRAHRKIANAKPHCLATAFSLRKAFTEYDIKTACQTAGCLLLICMLLSRLQSKALSRCKSLKQRVRFICGCQTCTKLDCFFKREQCILRVFHTVSSMRFGQNLCFHITFCSFLTLSGKTVLHFSLIDNSLCSHDFSSLLFSAYFPRLWIHSQRILSCRRCFSQS